MDLAHTPSLPPPPGTTPNVEHPVSLAGPLIATNVIFLVLMIPMAGIRFYSRKFITGRLGWDDYTCLIAVVGSIAHTILVTYITRLKFGLHLWDIPIIDITPTLIKCTLAVSIIYYPIIFMVKFSILLLYLRIFGIDKKIRYLIYGGIIFQFFFYLAFTALESSLEFLCTSLELDLPTVCQENFIPTAIQAVVNVATDFYVLALPITTVWNLQQTLRRRLGVIAIFLTGFLACVISIVRMGMIFQRLHNADFLWTGALISCFTAVEINVGIICGCFTAIPVFLRKHPIRPVSSYLYRSVRSRLFRDKNSGTEPLSNQLGSFAAYKGNPGVVKPFNERDYTELH